MGNGFPELKPEELFEEEICQVCFTRVWKARQEKHLFWHKMLNDPVFALFHTQVGIRRGDKGG